MVASCFADPMQWQGGWPYPCRWYSHPCQHEWLHKGCSQWDLCPSTCACSSELQLIFSWCMWMTLCNCYIIIAVGKWQQWSIFSCFWTIAHL